ncbi:MAG: Bug family tripartite tricarboxylate transporter substrate binding protein [Lautropia sp.]
MVALAVAGSLAVHATPARAQAAFPSKPIKLVVPYPAGGVVDQVARLVTEHMSRTLGQPIVVENKPGASANIGTDQVLRAPADGYTFLMGSPYLATNPHLMKSTKWKTADFVGVGLVGAPPNVFVAANNVPAKTMKEFVAYVKARPGQLNVTNPGVGTSNHMGQELFFSTTGLEMQNVMYKGQPAMMPDVASGQVSFSLMTMALAAPHLKEGRFKALAISAPKRAPDLPDVPTIAEAGFPDAMFLPWYGMVAAAATPAPIVKTLSDAFMKAIGDPGVVAGLEKIGTQLTPAPGSEFTELLKREAVRWEKIIKERGIKPVG